MHLPAYRHSRILPEFCYILAHEQVLTLLTYLLTYLLARSQTFHIFAQTTTNLGLSWPHSLLTAPNNKIIIYWLMKILSGVFMVQWPSSSYPSRHIKHPQMSPRGQGYHCKESPDDGSKHFRRNRSNRVGPHQPSTSHSFFDVMEELYVNCTCYT